MWITTAALSGVYLCSAIPIMWHVCDYGLLLLNVGMKSDFLKRTEDRLVDSNTSAAY